MQFSKKKLIHGIGYIYDVHLLWPICAKLPTHRAIQTALNLVDSIKLLCKPQPLLKDTSLKESKMNSRERSLNWAHLLANYFVHSLYKKWKENKILHRSVYVWSVFLYPSTDESATIRVTNLSEDTRESDLMELFRPFGPISRIFLAKDKQTNQSKVISFQQ